LAKTPGRIRVGVGGWTYEPWRETFYPPDLPVSRELEYASRQLTTLEINGTYYSTQKPATFAKWREQTPEGFVFSVKASRYTTNRRELATGGESINRFLGSGLAELGPKLGPILWQFMPTKQFDTEDFEAFLQLLPQNVDGLPLRHVMDVRHDSFRCAEYLALARRYGVATVFADSDEYPSFADLTGDVVYARLMRTQTDVPTGYSPQALDRWAQAVRLWAAGGEPDLPRVGGEVRHAPRDVYVLFISGAKERAPAAAMALLERLRGPS
jgi:uncharacterized protein YecE (DUF72 family)